MLQFTISMDEKTQELSWVGNISPAQVIALLSRYLESTIVALNAQIAEAKKEVANEPAKPTE